MLLLKSNTDFLHEFKIESPEGNFYSRSDFEWVDLVIIHTVYGSLLKKFSTDTTKENYAAFELSENDVFKFKISKNESKGKPKGKYECKVRYAVENQIFEDGNQEEEQSFYIEII